MCSNSTLTGCNLSDANLQIGTRIEWPILNVVEQMSLALTYLNITTSFLVASTKWHRLKYTSRLNCSSKTLPIIANRTSAIVSTHLNERRSYRFRVSERCPYVIRVVLFTARKIFALISWWSAALVEWTLTLTPVSMRKLMPVVESCVSNRRPLLIMLTKVTVILDWRRRLCEQGHAQCRDLVQNCYDTSICPILLV